MKNKPYVGQKITLNNHGLKVIFGNHVALSHMKTKVFTVIAVGGRVPVDNWIAWDLEIDDPEINRFLFDSGCFDETT